MRTLLALALCALVATPALAQVAPPPLPPYMNVGAPFTAVRTLYAEDFESGPGDFVAEGNASWEWGQPLVHVQPVTGQGPGMWGTNLAGVYNDHACGSITSPTIDLSIAPLGAETGARAARLVFRSWMQSELTWDGGVVQASSDGVTWRVLQPLNGYDDRMISSTVRACLGVASGERVFTGPSGSQLPPANDWDVEEFDLTSYLGGPVQLRWVFATDTSAVRLGWYVDDVVVQLGFGASARVDIPRADPVGGVPFTPTATLFAEDFEADDGGWTATGTSAWEWGEAVAPPLPPTGSLNMWGTHLASDYAPDECAYLTSPPILLPGSAAPARADAQAARMTVQIWRHLRNGYDGAQMQASIDGGDTWLPLVPTSGYDRTLLSGTATQAVRDCLGVGTTDRVWSGPSSAPKPEDWIDATFDLTPFMGREVVFRLAFASGSTGVVARGVYMGDLIIELGAGLVLDPNGPRVPALPTPLWKVEGTNPSWAYGFAQSGPSSTVPVWATNLHGNYGPGECSTLTSEPIDTRLVAGLGRLELELQHFHASDSFDDGGVISVSADDGATWTVVTPYTGYSGTLATDADECLGLPLTGRGFTGSATGNQYQTIEVPLTSYQDKVIRIRFAFFSDASTQGLGWYLRNVQLSRGGAPLPLSLNVDLGKIDPSLLAGTEPAQALVAGLPHGDLRALAHVPRDEAWRTVQTLAAPFLERVAAFVEASGGEVLALHPSAPAVAVRAPSATLAALAAREDVRYVAADADDAVRLVDPVFDTEESGVGVQNIEGRQMLQTEEAWAAGFRGEGIKIAIIDTGIDATHEAFRRADGSHRIEKWLDLVNGHPTPYDDQGHGTHVAATAAGSEEYDDPTFGPFTHGGVAPKATLFGAKFLNSAGSGSLTNGIAALEWAFNESADITSNSWGSACTSGAVAILATVHSLTQMGMLNVFAAGNSGPSAGSIGSPACSDAALSVGAVGSNGVIASFSSRGPCTDIQQGTPSRICPDVVAKGYLVKSAAPRGSCSLCHPSGYLILNGTSMATPHVAGAAALIEQMKRAITGTGWDTAARAEEEVLKLTATDLGPAGEDNTYGWGLPQIMVVYALLLDTDEANIVPSFGVSKTLLRQGDSATLTFGVRNLGAAVASGDFRATLTRPDGTEVVLKASTPALALLDKESYTGSFVVTNAVPFGTYTFRGSFVYSYTNSTSGEVVFASVVREAPIEVKRVQVQVALEGLAPRALPLELQQVRYTATNVGNENASKTTIEFTVPDDYVFVPGENYDPQAPRTRYANPAPTSVIENQQYGRVTLIFSVGDLPQGASFSFTTNLLPTTPGDYRVLSVAKYFDAANNAFSSGAAVTQRVAVP